MVLFLFIPHMARAQFEFSSSTWSDASPWFGENAIYISVWVGDGERIGINREDPRYEFDLSGDMATSGDATWDGSVYVNGTLDVSGDIVLDSVTIGEDITFDGSAFITVDLDVSADLTANTITVASDATFDGTVSLSENVTFSMAADEYLLLDAATAAHTQTAGALDINVVNGANSVSGILMDLEAENGFTPMYGLYINIDDDGAGGDETVHGIYITNPDGTASLTQGITFVNNVDDDIVSTLGAAGQFAVIDAAATDHTETGGVIDIAFDSTADGASVINIDMDVDTSSDSATVSAILIDLDDDTDQTADIIGVKVTSSDLTGATDTKVIGFYSSGLDVALQADNGYVRIGTGSTPDVTPGDDDLFVEGTSEVDGAARFDGAVDCNGGVDITGDLTTNTIVVSGDATFDGSLYTAGGMDVTGDLTTNTITVSGNSAVQLLTVGGSLATTGDATFDGSLYASGGADITGDLTVNIVTVSGDATFDGAVNIDNGLDVTGDLTTNTITVSGDSGVQLLTVGGSLAVTGDATFDGSLYGSGGADITGDMTVNTLTVSNGLTTDALIVSGDVSYDGTVSVNSLLIYEPSTAQVIDATSDAILANATMVILNPDADYTTDVTPTIADGTIGQILYITCANGEANRVRLQDEDYLAATNLELGDTSRDVSGKDVLVLMYDGEDWAEISYADN